MSEKKAKLPWGLKNEAIAPGSAKSISLEKLKAFNIGTMNLKKTYTKKEQDDMKKKEDEVAAAQVYEEFVASFEDTGKVNKTWVKGETVQHGGKTPIQKPPDKPDKPGNRLYKPSSKLAELASTFQSNKSNGDSVEKKEEKAKPPKKKMQDKKKSNLELFKEELKSMQEERQERHKMKKSAIIPSLMEEKKSKFESTISTPALIPAQVNSVPQIPTDDYDTIVDDIKNFNYEDQNTTNLYLGNINPKMTEHQLCELFGKFGPLASVKVMWPRSEEEHARGRNCGFVAYMNRKDGERALQALQGRMIFDYEMKLGWGKPVQIPPHPIYIPPAMLEMTMPPPPSGLPFNGQRKDQVEIVDPNLSSDERLEKTLFSAVIKVVIPTDRNLLSLIHRVVEFVVREGPMFEAMIMNRELNNPTFRFLFENQSPAHIYYRWKLFSILQGDSLYHWRLDEFRMFKGGSLWKPPPINPYTQGMPDELVNLDHLNLPIVPKKGQLPDEQRDKLEDVLRDLQPDRSKVGDAMVWCLEHAESAEEIVECIAESLSILETPLPKKIARLFLINDLLFNCGAKVINASFFRKFFESKLPEIFTDLHTAYEKIDARLKAEQFKQKVMSCFRVWEDWAVYPNEFLIKLQNTFLGLVYEDLPLDKIPEIDGSAISDIDGAPIDDIDGFPLDKSLNVLKDDLDGIPLHDDIDGAPLDDPDLDGVPLSSADEFSFEAPKGSFKKSKWETLDPEDVKAQAMTTSKWDSLEQDEDDKPKNVYDDDLDGEPMADESQDNNSNDSDSPGSREDIKPEMTEERRAKLREIELKVIKYQDELETGKRTRKPGLSFNEQVQHYRQKLVQKEEDKAKEKEKEKRREEWERARERDKERERHKRYNSSSDDDDAGLVVPQTPSHRPRDRREDKDREHERSKKKSKKRDKQRSRQSSDSPSEEEEEEYDYDQITQALKKAQKRVASVTPLGGKSRRSYSSDSSAEEYTVESPPKSVKRRSISPKSSHRSRSPKRSRNDYFSPRISNNSRSRSRSPNSIRQKHKKKKHKN